tara:strand:- start:2516 stop:2824 length:309 start_codon:yes stop_codon:yes gene_type:complete
MLVMSQEGKKKMGKKINWEPGTTETSQEIRREMVRLLAEHTLSTSLADCLDFMYETMVVAGASACAAGLSQEEAAGFFNAALADLYDAIVLSSSMTGERAEA